jgi:hypothetical protein
MTLLELSCICNRYKWYISLQDAFLHHLSDEFPSSHTTSFFTNMSDKSMSDYWGYPTYISWLHSLTAEFTWTQTPRALAGLGVTTTIGVKGLELLWKLSTLSDRSDHYLWNLSGGCSQAMFSKQKPSSQSVVTSKEIFNSIVVVRWLGQ